MTPQQQKAGITHALMSTTDYEGTYGKLWRAMQGKPQNAWASSAYHSKKPQAYDAVWKALTSEYQATSELANNCGFKGGLVYTALQRLKSEGKARLYRTSKINFWKRA